MDGVAGEYGLVDCKRHAKEGQACVLHDRLHEQPLGKTVDQSAWSEPPLDQRFFFQIVQIGRSEERRVGKECVSTCRSRWSPSHEKKQLLTHVTRDGTELTKK